MSYHKYPLIIASTIFIHGCSPTGTPLIDMCKKITQNVVGTVETWGEPEKTERTRHLFVSVAYTTGSGDTGTAECDFPPAGDRGSPGNDYRSSPRAVSLNGQEIPQKQLMQASLGASKEVLKETADETKEQATELAADIKEKSGEMAVKAEELAGDAKDKARELADEASVMAGEAKQKAAELADEARLKAGELADQASDVAGAASDKAREVAIEAAKTVQEKLEN